jgi:hypothetical protein
MLHDIAWPYFSADPIRRQSFFVSSMSLEIRPDSSRFAIGEAIKGLTDFATFAV